MDCVIYFSLPVLRESIYCCMADQAKYKQLLNSLEEAAVMLDRSGKVLHSNPIFRELAGLQKPESAAMTDIFPEIPESWLADSLQAGDVAAFVFQSSRLQSECLVSLIPADGHAILMLWTQPTVSGNAVGLNSLSQLPYILPFGLVLIDQHGRIEKANAAARKLLSIPQEKSGDLNQIWSNSRDRANRRRSIDRAPWNRALEQSRSIRMGPVTMGQSVLDLYCIPIRSQNRAQVLVVVQDMHREHRNQKRLRGALELNRSINQLLMDLLRVPGPEDTIHRALRGALELIRADECLLITEEEYGSRVAFVEGERQDLLGRENKVDPWEADPALQKEGAFLIRRMDTLESLLPDVAPHEYRGCLAASVLYEKNRRGLVLLLRKESKFRSRERRILQLLVPALSAAIFKFRYEARLNLLATTDPLTGLLNRRRFFAILESAVKDEPPPSILQMDLDLFKQINDSLGHQAGDRVLEVLAVELKKWEAKGAVPARTGGEEFMVLLRGDLSENYRRIAEDLRQSVEALEIEWQPNPIRFTISIGATRFHPGEKLADFYARADKLLYEAKESGRNKTCFETAQLPGSGNGKSNR